MDVRHYAFLARQPSADLKAREHFWGMPKRGLAFLLANVMFWQPMWAQADGIVVASPGTSLGQAGNGVPIVNIATPNGSGLSHNQFHDYNVDTQGVILNNGSTQTSTTQLGGIIVGNPHLKNSGSAQTILNEVVGGSPSQLRGYTEVAGQSARVIVANPYGITCNGCGFINTPRATLTTGKPVLDGSGRLDHFQVDQGSIAIEGAGLNASNVDSFEILTRSAKINAEIQANNLTIVAGRNDVDAQTLNATARADDGSAKPQLAIDSSALGGMYAGAIKLVGTEAGVGVKLAGNLAASGGDIQIDASGHLTLAQTTAVAAVNVKAASLDGQGPVYAGSSVNVQTHGDLTNQQTLAARDSITLSAGGQLANNGIIEAGVNADTSRNVTGDVSLSAQNLNNTGKSVVASRNLTVSAAQTLNNQGGTFSAGQNADISVATLDNRNNGRVLSSSALNVTADQVLNSKGLINSAGSLTGTVGQLTNSDAGLIAATGPMSLTARDIVNDAGRISGKGDVQVETDSLSQLGGELVATGNLQLTGKTLHNQKDSVVASSKSLTVKVDQIDNQGTLFSEQALSIDARQLNNNGGSLLTNGALSLELNGGDINNQLGLINTNGVLNVAHLRDLDNQQGEVSSANSFSLSGDTLNNQGGKLISNDQLTLDAASVQNQGGLISGWNALTVTGGTLDNSQEGTLSSLLGNLNIDLSGALINNTKGGLGGKGEVTLKAASFDNRNGIVTSGGGQQLTVTQGAIDNSAGGLIESGGTLELNAPSLNNALGKISAQKALTFTGTDLDNSSGSFAGNDSVTLDLLGILTNTKGALAGTGPLMIKRSSRIDNQGGQIVSQNLLSLLTGQMNNNLSGTVAANGQLDFVVTGSVNNDDDGLIYSRDAGLGISAGSISNVKGSLQSHDALTLDVQGGAVDNQGGKIIARTGDLNVNAGRLDNRNGELSSLNGLLQTRVTGLLRNGQGGKIEGNRLDLQALGGIYSDGGRIAANNGDILLDAGGAGIDNSGGGIYAKGLVKVIADALNNNAGQISGQTIDLDLAADLGNRDGLIESGSSLKLRADSVDNQSGKLRALGTNGTTDFQIGSLFDNRNGLLETANTNLILATPGFLNAGGNVTHVGVGDFAIATANVMGAGGTLVTRGDLTLNADSWTNSSVIQATRLTVNVNNFAQTASGQLLASNHFEGRGGNWTNDGLIASDGTLDVQLLGTYGGNGRMTGLGDMQVDAAAINLGSAGSISGGGHTTVGGRGGLATVNNQGRLTAANGLILKANTVNNYGTLAGGTGLKLSASSLLNDQGGFLFSGGELALRVGSFTNRKSDVYSLGAIDIARDDAGNRATLVENLSGTMESVGDFSVKADSIVNKRDQFTTQSEMYTSAIGVRCYSCDVIPINWVEDQVRWHLVYEQKYRVTVSGDASSPAALINAGGNMNLMGSSFLNSNSTVAATGNVNIAVNDFENSGTALGDYSSLQYFNYEDPAYRDRLVPFSEIVQYNIFNDATYNKDMHFWNAAGVESPVYPRDGVQGAKPFEKEYFQIIGPVVLLLGGAGAKILSEIDFSDSQYSSGVRTDVPDFLKNATPFSQVVTTSGAANYVPAVIQAGGNVSINATNRISNGTEQPFSSGVSSHQRDADLAASGTGRVSVIALNSQLPPDLAQQQVNPLSLPGFSLPTGSNGLFRLNDQSSSAPSAPVSNTNGINSSLNVARVQGLPDHSTRSNPHKYLIETNPVLTDLKQFMSSDYLLANLGFDPDASAKRLGDGFYEQRLIQQAVVERTGQRFIDGQTSDEAMFKYLMNNAIASKDALNLSVGVTLTSQQVAALTHDIVWLEEQEVNGEKVLVPVLYLAQANNRLAPNGALIQGGDVTLIAGQDLNNAGTLRATNNLAASAGKDLTNSGLAEAGNRLDLLAGNNIVNQSGGVIAGRDVNLNALAGDVINERTVSSASFANKGYTQLRDYLDSAARIEAANDLSITAGRDVLNTGSALVSGRDTKIDAGRDISLVSAEQQSANTGGKKRSSVTQSGSTLDAGRDITLNAGRDINVIASDIDAKRNIGLAAQDDLLIASGADETHSYHKTRKVTAQEDHIKQVASTLTAGGDVNLSAGNNLTLVSSRVSAGDEAYLVAGNNIELLAAQDTDYSLYDKKKKGNFGQKETRHDEVTDVVNIGSQIKTGGDLSLVSGGNQLYQGAKLESGKDLTLDSGGSITFEAVKDLHQESHEKSSNSLAWTSAKGKGNTDETFRQSELVAQGKLAIKAVDGLNIDIKQIDQKSVSQTIDAMVLADPQLAWLKDAEKRGDVDWHKVQEVHESFKYSHSGLGQGAMLAIIIIVTALTAGAASAAIGTAANATVASGTAMAAAGTSAAGTAVAAGWGNVALTAIATSAAGGAAISTINNKGNIGAVIKDVTSSESLKGYVVAGVSGGIGGANIGVRLAVNSALQTVVNGGKFNDNLSQAVIGLVADMMAGAIYEQVGTSLLGSGLPTKVAVHAIVGGLIGEAAGGDFATSALAAGANEALIQMAGDKIFPGVAHEQVLAMTSQLLGMTVAAAAGGSDKDQQVAGWVAQQATVNNYLGHEQKEALAKKLDATCHGNIQCIQGELDKWKPLADSQNGFSKEEQSQFDEAQKILSDKLLENCQSTNCNIFTLIDMQQAGLDCGTISCLRESAGKTQKSQYLMQDQWGKLLLDALGDGGAIAGALGPIFTASKGTGGIGVVADELGVGAKGAGAVLPDSAIINVRAISADQANAPFVARGWNPPYDAGTQVRTFTANTDIQFVRVSTVDNPQGAFLVRSDEISGMTPLQIQQYLALPKTPTQIADVNVPMGTNMQVGRIAAQPDFGANNKGGVQYQLLDQIPSSSFGVPRPLK
jgi:filamentous hemagglutinin